MEEHKIFKTAAVPIIFLITGLKHFNQNLILSIVAGIGIYLIAFYIDKFIEKR